MNWKSFFKRESAPPSTVASPVVRRLAGEFALLNEIEFERASRCDPFYGQGTEERIIWRELLDLELQEMDEEISRRVA